MANVRAGNTFYIDSTTGEVTQNNIQVVYAIVSPTASNAVLTLKDRNQNSSTKLDLKNAGTDVFQLSFEKYPIIFSEGLKVDTVTNCVATLVLKS